MRKKGKFHGSLLSAVMILVILFTALGEKGISAKAETSEKEEVKEVHHANCFLPPNADWNAGH